MTKNLLKLDKLNTYRESSQIEAKAAQGGLPDTLWDTYSAFANTDGGCILLGVKEQTDCSLYVVGLKDAVKMEKDFWNMVNNRQKISVNLMTDKRVRIETINGKDILVLDVPRADRSSRPVYKGQDPRTGTYRRNGEGDYLCSLEEVSAMFRDAALAPQDAKVVMEMDMTVFCQETIRSYRQIFRNTHPTHVWNNLEDEIFLRRIGAIAIADDAVYRPTAAGLLMFGYEYEILREFPQYFLDFQENRQVLQTRWTDRIISSSGDWSGNVFDFVLKVIPKLTTDLKVPFALKGTQRIDDTPIHKALREATTNSVVHADFYGRRGLVITKNSDAFTFANPGSMRVAKNVAIEGGVSDPRNGILLKMFSLINYGERAGSGLNSICYIWERVYHTKVCIQEEMGVDRVILTLSYGKNKPDMNAMLSLQESVADEKVAQTEEERLGAVDSQTINQKNIDKLSIKAIIIDKLLINNKDVDKLSINKTLINRLCDIVVYLNNHPRAKTENIADLLNMSASSAKQYLRQLMDMGIVSPDGANKNRTYSLSHIF